MAMNELQSGQVLEMFATDPGSANDIGAWAKRTGNELLATNENPSRDEIVRHMDTNICRCGTYNRIVAAIQRAARGS